MKILFLTPIFPAPINSGIRMRMVLSLKMLASVGKITMISFSKEEGQESSQERILDQCSEVLIVPHPVSVSKRALNSDDRRTLISRVRIHLLDPRPWCTRCWDSTAFHRSFLSVRPESFDLVWVQGVGLYGQVIPYGLPRVAVDLPDAESVRVRREWRGRLPGPRLALDVLDWLKLRRAERRWGWDRHWFLVCSEKDRQRLARRGNKVWVMRNAVPMPTARDVPSTQGADLVFVGSLAYRPNREAAFHFVSKVLPLIHRSCPEARFYLVGSEPPPEMRNLGLGSGVVIAGEVERVAPYLCQASVVVVPLLNGSGTRVKILEAMSFGKPVVSTSIGAEGLEVQHDENILLANSPPEFASACIRLLQNAELRQRLGEAGRRFVKARYTPEHAQCDLREFLSAILLMKQPQEWAGELETSRSQK